MASPVSPVSTAVDHIHEDRGPYSPQQMMESLIRSLSQCSAEPAYKGISAILHENDGLREKKAGLEQDLAAALNTNMRIVDRIKAAEAERDHKQGALVKLQQERDHGQAELERTHEQVATLTAEITATKEEITKTFKSKDETEQRLERKTQENSAQKEELRLNGEMLQGARKKLDALQKEHDKDHAELVSLRSKAVSLQELPKSARPALTKRIRGISERAHDLVYRFFGQLDLDRHVFGGEKWSSLTRDKRLEGIHLVSTNSPVATRMREASVLRLLALSALDHLFQPVYLTEFGTEISHLVEHLYQGNPEYAHWLRSVLLNIDPEAQAENAHKRVEAVVKEVTEGVDFLLQPAGPDTIRDFHDALEHWCEESTGVWLDLQRLTYAFQCFFEPHLKDIEPNEWTPLPESPVLLNPPPKPTEVKNGTNGDTTKKPTTADMAPSSTIAAQIWPMLLAVKKNGNSEVVVRGYALTDVQVQAARDEVVPNGLQDRAHSRRLKRRQEKNRRIMSGDNDSTGSFLEI